LDSLPPTVTRLIIDDNFTQSDTPALAGALSKLIDRNTALRSLSLAGGEKTKLREELTQFFRSLKTNRSLTEIDVTNNSFLDSGMSVLASALRENSTLTSVKYVNYIGSVSLAANESLDVTRIA